MKTAAIIPARMDSSRFPGKPMKEIHGMPMIGHIFQRSKFISNADIICVATCDQEIFDYINDSGGIAVMTSDKHKRATERTAEALTSIEKNMNLKINLVAMIQGDEPMFSPSDIDAGISQMKDDMSINIVNLMNEAMDDDDFHDQNNVKVVTSKNGDALYYSREPIPSNWPNLDKYQRYIQTGLMIFKSNYLNKFLKMDPTPLENIESCDMLRVLEHGDSVRMVLSETRSIGVDTPADLAMAEKLLASDEIMSTYIS